MNGREIESKQKIILIRKIILNGYCLNLMAGWPVCTVNFAAALEWVLELARC